jgi:hypothetical protein
MAQLSDPTELADFVGHEIEANAITRGTVVSLAIDAMAMTAQHSTAQRTSLPSGGQQIAFVIFLQPLDARFKCFPLHVMTHSSGRATGPFQEALDSITRSVTEHGFMVKYLCVDGDSCYHRRDLEYFHRWYSILIERALSSTLLALADDVRIRVGECLHSWKTYCNKINNHPVTLIPGSTDAAIQVDDLESLFQLGRALLDKFTVGGRRTLMSSNCSAGRTA